MSSPNILYLHSHDTGRYVQPYGHAVPTPNLQETGRAAHSVQAELLHGTDVSTEPRGAGDRAVSP